MVIIEVLDTLKSINSHKIKRYDKKGVKIQDIEIDDIGYMWLDWKHACITENRNGDMIIYSDELEAVVVIDSSGGHRFMYFNSEFETPMNICTDKYGQILVTFYTSIHLLDKDGTFQKILLRNMSSSNFLSLCLDDKQNLNRSNRNRKGNSKSI